MQTFLKILKLVSPYKWWMLLATFLGFLTVGSSIGLLMTSAYIIAKAALHPDIGQLQVGIVGVRFFGITRGLFRYAERLFSHEVTFKLLSKFRVWFFESIAPLVPSKTGKFTSGDLLSRVVADVESLEHFFIRVISPPLVALLIGMLMFLIFSFYSITIALVFLIPYLLGAVAVPVITYKLSKTQNDKIILLRAKLTELTLDGIDGKDELTLFGKVENHKEEFNKTNLQLIKLQRKMELISGMNESIIGLLMNIAVVLIFIVAIPFVKSGLFNGIHLSVLTLGTMAAFEAVLPIPLALQYLNSTLKAAERVFEIAEQIPTKEKNTNQLLHGKTVTLKNVNFSYSENEEILKNIAIELSTKRKIAIIGGSGAGKSSIINLLLKFWEANSGELKIDNINYKELSGEQARTVFSTIPQKVFLFSNTIKENLLIAKPTVTDNELWDALQKAELSELVKSLPNKLNTWVGNQGKELSGGEKKRIAIARAILQNAPIFICDEITADVDSINELKIINTIHSITKEKALIFITHRLVDMEKFDSIFMLEDGEIISVGSHNELISKSKKYQNFFGTERI